MAFWVPQYRLNLARTSGPAGADRSGPTSSPGFPRWYVIWPQSCPVFKQAQLLLQGTFLTVTDTHRSLPWEFQHARFLPDALGTYNPLSSLLFVSCLSPSVGLHCKINNSEATLKCAKKMEHSLYSVTEWSFLWISSWWTVTGHEGFKLPNGYISIKGYWYSQVNM